MLPFSEARFGSTSLPLRLSGIALVLSLTLATSARAADLLGRVVDSSGGPVAGATVRLVSSDRFAESGAGGSFRLSDLGEGPVEIAVTAPGFLELFATVEVSEAKRTHDLVLAPDTLRAEVTVVGRRLVSTAERAEKVPGSYDALHGEEIELAHVLTTHEALRKVPGLHTRDEEGLGLRPNIGLRGLNPTRSSKVLLLEDGLPLAYAPYGDNASYYHPPIERFEAVEVLKGSAQIAYGPQTLGGVVNYLTASPPSSFAGSLAASAGDREFLNARASLGTTVGRWGLLVDAGRKEGEGARENLRSDLDDLSFKVVSALDARQTLTAKSALYRERSQLTYSGLTQAEYDADPRQNPFKNDALDFENLSASLIHDWVASGRVLLSTALYGSRFDRDWWRQSSNSGQRPNDRNDPACGGLANLSTTCGNEGRLREYRTWGLTPRLQVSHSLFGKPSQLHAGLRWHEEEQERRQKNGPRPTSRDGVVVEDNRRVVEAFSAFADQRFFFGEVTVTPGVRFESIDYERTNRLANAGAGVTGETSLREVLPGLGLAWQASSSTTVFAGAHRGFSPPRAEDIVSNAGGVVELGPELSWNYELGVRSRPVPGLTLSATAFRMDYENQIVPASLAGGVGATLTNGGETLHEGVEGALTVESAPLFGVPADLFLRASWTWLPTAEFRGTRTSSVAGFASVSVAGNRLPYAPETLLTASLGYRHPRGVTGFVEAVYTSDQFGDDLNTVTASADGQRGLLPAYWIWNAVASFDVPRLHTRLHVTVKNLFDETAIVDRARGVLPSMPRTFQAGFKLSW
jgi:Fe(3+) dicitrate transport protein